MTGKRMAVFILGTQVLMGCIKGHESYVTTGGNLPTNYIIINSNSFSPSSLAVAAGSSITFVNNDNAVHSIRSDDSTSINSNPIPPGSSYIFKKDTTGVFNYHCSLHPAVRGTFILTP